MADEPSALCVLIDVSPREWSVRPAGGLAALMDQLLIFANAFHLLSASNRLAVICVHPSTACFAWPPADSRAAEAALPPEPRALRAALDATVQQLLALPLPPPDESPSGSPLAAALALALCRLQRVRRALPKAQPRILAVHATPDVPAHHLACMNGVFAAQKQEVLIDALMLAPHDSLLLQQAADLTGGNYLRPTAQIEAGLVQYLLTCCLPDQYARRFLRPPTQGLLETRALCHISKTPVEVGWACSVCLTVFGEDRRSELRECPVCGTRFPLPTASRPPPRKKKRPAAAPPPADPPAPAASSGAAAPPARVTVPPLPPNAAMKDWQRAPAPG